jgi:hypothetical protein
MVEAITDTDLVYVDGAVPRVGMSYLEQQLLQGMTKLHGFVGCQFYGVSVDAIEGQIHNETGAAATLWNTPKRGHAKAAKVPEAREKTEFPDSQIGQNHPETLGGKISHLFPHKVDVVVHRGVGAALELSIEVSVRPANCTSNDWHTIILEGSEEAGGRMGKAFKAGG